MAMPDLDVPDYPDVPNSDGVPPVARDPSAAPDDADDDIATADSADAPQDGAAPIWGVYDADGAPVAIADTAVSIEYRADSRISTYPQEEGGFAAYNKVQVPYDARVALACGKSQAAREAFLAAIDDAKQSTDLYSIVTPDAVYDSANIVAYDYRRTSRNGASLLIVELYLQEVRETATADYADTQNPASQDATNLGQVQGQQPTAGQSALFGPVAVTTGVGGVQ